VEKRRIKERRFYLDYWRDVPRKFIVTATMRKGEVKMSQAELSDALGITRSTLVGWLSDPRFKAIEELYRELDEPMKLKDFTNYVMNLHELEEIA